MCIHTRIRTDTLTIFGTTLPQLRVWTLVGNRYKNFFWVSHVYFFWCLKGNWFTTSLLHFLIKNYLLWSFMNQTWLIFNITLFSFRHVWHTYKHKVIWCMWIWKSCSFIGSRFSVSGFTYLPGPGIEWAMTMHFIET